MRAVLVMLCVAMAGCFAGEFESSGASEATYAADDEPAPIMWPAGIDGCTEVSGVSVYPIEQYSAVGPPEPWVVADISQAVGNPMIGSAGGIIPPVATGGIAGHWHSAITCDLMAMQGYVRPHDTVTVSFDATWGFVGIDVEAPPFDTGGADRHVLLAVWSWPNAQIRQAFHDVGHATETETASTTLEGPAAAMLLDDDEHGRYEGAGPVVADGSVHERLTRFWMLMPTEGHPNHSGQVGPFRPVSFDMSATPMDRSVSPETIGPFAHTQTDHHAPLPGLAANAAIVVHDGFSATIQPGPAPDVWLNATWVH